jgi:hypothetical protein
MNFLSTPLGLLLISLFPFGLIRPAGAQKPVEPGANEDPRAAIEGYFAAHALADSEFIRQTFTPDAKIRFHEGGESKVRTRDEFAKRFRQPATDEYRRVRRVERLDVSGTAASTVVTLDYPQVLFTDHMSLLKIGGGGKL